jgi:hypothetical protein
MRRRDFIKGIVGSATPWPLAAPAQQAGKLPTIGFLGSSASAWRPWTDAFAARLRELGFRKVRAGNFRSLPADRIGGAYTQHRPFYRPLDGEIGCADNLGFDRLQLR